MSRQGLIVCALVAAFAPTPFFAVGCGEARATGMAAAAQTSNRGGVKITVAPRGFPPGAETWAFAITLESHSGTLDDDLANSATLLANGKSYRPLNWEGAPPGGHHRKGVLRFEAVTPLPQAVELQIRRTGEASPRISRWQVGR